MIGIGGTALTTTFVAAAVEEQPLTVALTE
jgi:hypothetical protein